MFNAVAVLTQVYQNRYPANWRVYRGKSTKGNAITLFTIFAIISGFFAYSQLPLLFGNPFAVLSVLAFLFFVVGVFASVKCGKVDRRSIFVITPEGVVQCYGWDVRERSSLYFPHILEIKLMQRTVISGDNYGVDTKNYFWLDVYCVDGEYFQWRPLKCFGDTEFMCKMVIAAYKQFLYLNYSNL